MNVVVNGIVIFLGVLVVTFIGCQSAPDFEMLRSEILNLHKAAIDAHWNKDLDFFVKDLSENYVFVADGEIQKPTVEEMRSQFSGYINNTTFTEYRDLKEPIIGISKDGSMAWSVVQVKVAGKRAMDDGSQKDVDFTCAYITVYERQGDTWLRVGDVSTFK